jgi:hypothetical protein
VEISVSRVRLNTETLYTAIVRDIRERRAHQNGCSTRRRTTR